MFILKELLCHSSLSNYFFSVFNALRGEECLYVWSWVLFIVSWTAWFSFAYIIINGSMGNKILVELYVKLLNSSNVHLLTSREYGTYLVFSSSDGINSAICPFQKYSKPSWLPPLGRFSKEASLNNTNSTCSLRFWQFRVTSSASHINTRLSANAWSP